MKIVVPKLRDLDKTDMRNWNPLEQFVLDFEPAEQPHSDDFHFKLKEALEWIYGQLVISAGVKEIVVCSPLKQTPKIIQITAAPDGTIYALLDNGELWKQENFEDEEGNSYIDWVIQKLPNGASQNL